MVRRLSRVRLGGGPPGVFLFEHVLRRDHGGIVETFRSAIVRVFAPASYSCIHGT